MLRVVSAFLPEDMPPYYLILCDDPRCGMSYQHPVPAGENNIDPERQAINESRGLGWLIAIGRQLCPGHFAQVREIEDAGLGTKKVIRPEGITMRNGKLVTQ